MSNVGFPNFGPEYTGFLHRHPPRPGYPEMNRHVVVDVEDWVIARQKAAEAPATSTNSDLMKLLQEWVTLEHQQEGASHEYTLDLSRRTYAVLAQLH